VPAVQQLKASSTYNKLTFQQTITDHRPASPRFSAPKVSCHSYLGTFWTGAVFICSA